MKTKAALIVLGFVLGACGADQPDPAAAAESEDPESISEPMTDAMDDAEAVEDQVMEQKDDIDEAVEDAEKSADDPPTDE